MHIITILFFGMFYRRFVLYVRLSLLKKMCIEMLISLLLCSLTFEIKASLQSILLERKDQCNEALILNKWLRVVVEANNYLDFQRSTAIVIGSVSAVKHTIKSFVRKFLQKEYFQVQLCCWHICMV